MTDRDRIIDKVKKCLALSASSNQHEAEIALRQAQKLMAEHGISEQDVQAAEADERAAKATVTAKPASWEALLANCIAQAFGCQVIFAAGWAARRAEWRFIGCGAAAEVARYAFTVLLRQLRQARQDHIHDSLRRCKVAAKRRRADLFCTGWVRAVAGKIAAFAGSEQQTAAIASFIARRYPETASLAPTNRNAGRKLREYDYGDLQAGRQAGRNAQLNRGVGDAQERRALQCA